MKGFSATILFFLLSAAICAQNVNNQVICSAGAFSVAASNGVSLGWTLGELIISDASGEAGNPVLAQGFQQSKTVISKVSLTSHPLVEALVFPNPAADRVNISLTSEYDGETVIFLIAPDGRVIDVEKMEPGVLLKQINIAKYKAGIYFMKIQNGDKHLVYQIIKL